MFFKISQQILSTHLTKIMGAIPSKPSHPILNNVLMKVVNNQVTLTAYDLNLGIETNFKAQILQEGNVALPAKLFYSLVTSLPDQELTLKLEETEENGLVVNLSLTSASYQLKGHTIEEFPLFPELENANHLNINTTTFIQGLQTVLSAISTDETKQCLTGIRLNIKNNTLEMVSTDGHRLALIKAKLPKENQGQNEAIGITIPGVAMKELGKLIGKPTMENDCDLNFQFNENQIIINLPESTLVCRALAGEYPQYQVLIPPDFQVSANITKDALIKAISRLSLLDSQNPAIRLTLDYDNQQINLYNQDSIVGNGVESLPALVNGNAKIAFNPKYLLQGVKAIPTSEVKFLINDGKTPALCQVVNSALDDCFVLLMPCFVEGFSDAEVTVISNLNQSEIIETEESLTTNNGEETISESEIIVDTLKDNLVTNTEELNQNDDFFEEELTPDQTEIISEHMPENTTEIKGKKSNRRNTNKSKYSSWVDDPELANLPM